MFKKSNPNWGFFANPQLAAEDPIISVLEWDWIPARPHCSPSLETMVNKGNHPKMTVIQASEIL